MTANQHSSQSSTVVPIGKRLLGIVALYAALAVVPPSPFEGPLYLAKLLTAPAPDRIAVPVDRVAAHDLRDSWGAARGGGRRHEGIDIFAPRGTRVRSATEGLVWRVGTNPLGGLVVLVLGPGGQMHYYAHLDGTSGVRAGDRIGVGDVLGFVGTSGNARGGPPHLHYGLYASGGAVNPYPLLVPDPATRTRGRRMPDRATAPGPHRAAQG